jgi:hypothetical protein
MPLFLLLSSLLKGLLFLLLLLFKDDFYLAVAKMNGDTHIVTEDDKYAIDKIFEKFDLDKDGRLSSDEAIAAYSYLKQ